MRAPASLRGLRSFTLIELLIVMAIIAILSAITLGVTGYVQRKAGASRAQAEIAAMGLALDKYKMDNGVYPPTTITVANTGTSYDPTVSPYTYTNNAAILYQALSGKTNYLASVATGPVYLEFTAAQVTTNAVGAGQDYVTDPFGYPYGYIADSGTTVNTFYNHGFYDLWSTRGQSGTGSQTNVTQWISNWSAN